MGILEILGVAGSLSLLAGWRLYLTIFVSGIAMHFGWLPLPENLQSLQILANPWILTAAALGTIAEFFADKVAWLDSAWDAIHGFIRPLGGALMALAIVDASDPVWQVIAFIIGGGGAFISHGAKASTRAAVNISPEPYSNVAVSTSEDVATTGLLALVITFPGIAIIIALLLLVAAVGVIIALKKVSEKFRKLFRKNMEAGPLKRANQPNSPPSGGDHFL